MLALNLFEIIVQEDELETLSTGRKMMAELLADISVLGDLPKLKHLAKIGRIIAFLEKVSVYHRFYFVEYFVEKMKQEFIAKTTQGQMIDRYRAAEY